MNVKTVIRCLRTALAAALLVLFCAGTVFAASAGVYDDAGLFDSDERNDIAARIRELRDKTGMDFAVVTTDENEDTAQEYAEQFYVDHDLGVGDDYSGVLLLIDMDNRELWLLPAGKMTRYLPDSRIEAVLDDIYQYASDGYYSGTAMAFLDDVETCYDNGIAADQYDQDVETGKISRYHSLQWYEILLALAAGAVCGGAAVAAVTREYSMKNDPQRIAANFKLSYRKDSRFRAANLLADVLLGSYITQQIIASAQNNRPGRPGGHIGGGFSGGGVSSTHTHSGRTFGGGGRKF